MADLYRGGFRLWKGSLLPPASRFWIVARNEIGRVRRSKWSRLLVYLSALPALVFILIRVGSSVASRAGAPIEIEVIDKLMRGQLLFAALLAASAGSGMIAQDRKTNALTLYLCRPLSVKGYILGKMIGLAAALAAVYLVPAAFYVLVEAATEPVFDFLPAAARLARVVAATSLHVLIVTALVLALSSLASRPKLVGLAWVMLYFFSDAAAEGAAHAFSHAAWTDLVSLPDLFEASGGYVLRGGDGLESLVILLALGFSAMLVVRWRVFRMARMAVSA